MNLASAGRMPGDRLTAQDVPRDASSKEYADFRDRAAYVYATGTFPTHVRTYFTGLLRAITDIVQSPTGLDGRQGTMKIDPTMVSTLRLEEHPMVRKVRSLIEKDGFVLARAEDLKQRRPYGKVRLVHPKTLERKTVHSDGTVSAED